MIQPVLPISPESHLQNPSCHIWYHSHRFRGLGHMSLGASLLTHTWTSQASLPHSEVSVHTSSPSKHFHPSPCLFLTAPHQEVTACLFPCVISVSHTVCFPGQAALTRHRMPSDTKVPGAACALEFLLTKLRFYLRAERGEGISQRREAERFQTG